MAASVPTRPAGGGSARRHQPPSRPRPIKQAARDLLAADPPWIPPTPTPVELGAGIAGGVFGALTSPVLAGPVLGALGRIGPPPARSEPTPADLGDPGWFGPRSVAWRVHSDPSMLVAGVAAFTLQSLHPLTMAGVAEHSAFSEDFLGRVQRTGEFVQGVVFGSSAQAERLCRMVRAVHRPVVGVAPDGRPYDAGDPALLEWVHIAEYLCIGAANRRFGLHPVSVGELDRYVAETARVGEATGVADPPRSWDGLLGALERHRRDLAVGEYAAAGIAFLEDPPILPAAAAPLWRAVWAGARACLPPVALRLLRLRPPSTVEAAQCRAVIRTLQFLGDGENPHLAAARRRLAPSA